jgi:superoxide reductase
MAERLDVFKCDICNQVIEVLEGGAGELVCCEEPMDLLVAKTADPADEKHVPFIEKVEGGIKVRVGKEAAHPMTPDHFIEWIEVTAGGKLCRARLNPGDAPEAFFACDGACGDDVEVVARELCNVHGLWRS